MIENDWHYACLVHDSLSSDFCWCTGLKDSTPKCVVFSSALEISPLVCKDNRVFNSQKRLDAKMVQIGYVNLEDQQVYAVREIQYSLQMLKDL